MRSDEPLVQAPVSVPESGYTVPAPARPAYSARIRDVRVAAGLTIAGLVLDLVLNAAQAAITPLVVLGGAGSEATQTTGLISAGLILLSSLARLLTAAAFIVWMYLARTNLDKWGIGGLNWTPGWTVGGWFVPVGNLFIPPRVLNDIGRGGQTEPDENFPPYTHTGSGLIWTWWVLYLAGNFLYGVVATFRADHPSTLVVTSGLGRLATITAAILAIVIVRRITATQERRQAALDSRLRAPRIP